VNLTIKWDSVTSYFPTVPLVFLELDCGKYPRRAQLKGRLPITGVHITPQMIDELKARAGEHSGFSLNHGNICANYVAPDKLFKKTINIKEKAEAVSALRVLCKILGEELHETRISYTDGLKRGSITRRTTPIGGTRAQQQDYRTSFRMKFVKVTFHIKRTLLSYFFFF
jgi:hypothetical protein